MKKHQITQNHLLKRNRLSFGLMLSFGLTAFLLSSNIEAQSFPDVPLQTSTNSPAANIMFILDDSGSMAFDYMPDGLTDEVFYKKNYSLNPLAYNPNKTYTTWKNYDQTNITGGTSYTSAYNDNSRLQTAINLSSNNQVFFGLKSGSLGNTTKSNYYQYTISYKSSKYSIERCEYTSGSTWDKNCTTATTAYPSSRSLTAELQNYATWYSYHRTRIKIAKAGVTETFSQLNANVRLGYDTIWNRNPLNIPVNTDNGMFRGSNKQAWFSRVLAANATGSTPLHGALKRAGDYFSTSSASGPWGPESGATQFSCRQNFTVLTTDGYWNDDEGYGSVGNADGTAGTQIVSTKGEKYTYNPTRPYTDAFSNTLADVAMYYWKTDLRPDLDNNVASSVQDPAFWQHMTTFGISIGLKGEFDPTKDLGSLTNGSKAWKNPWKKSNQTGSESWSNESSLRIDDLWHASINGRGTFNAATDPDGFSKSIKNALNAIQKKLASGSNVSTSSTSLQTDTRIFHATYYSGVWTGEVSAFDISSAGVAQDPSWIASENIPAPASRKVFTSTSTGGSVFPTADQKESMRVGLNFTGVTGDEIASFVKGDQSLEEINGGKFRNRNSILGTVVNSSPVYQSDTDTLYIGANDGMLHAMNALTGEELFAYVPRGINFENLGYTANPEYIHRYFVDGQQAVTTLKQTPGKNYLVGGLGRGGKGIYALDITSPSAFSAAKVLWDKTANTDSDMGYVVGDLLITKGNDGNNIVIVSNGLDSSSGSATLFVYRLDTGALIKKIVAQVGPNNALAPPRGWDNDKDGDVDYVYAGDLKGNLWKFDLSSSSSSSWGVALGGEPLFQAKDASNNPQPITGGLALGLEDFGDRMWILFGTGRYINSLDIVSTNTQSVYGIIDAGAKVTRAGLQERTISIVANSESTNLKLRAFETYSPLPSGKKGWFIDLGNPYPGERVIERGFLTKTVFVFPTVVPTSSNACESSGKGFLNAIDAFTGTSVNVKGVNFEYFDVGSDGSKSNDSIGPTGGKLPVGSIETNIGMVTKPIQVGSLIVYGGSDGGKTSTRVHLLPASTKRLSWREMQE